MNKILFKIILLFPVYSCIGQMTSVDPKPDEKPSVPFSNAIPDASAWTVTIKSQSELKAKKESRGEGEVPRQSPSAHLIVKTIDHAYAAGLRRETFHYGDGSLLTRYVTSSAVLFEDRVSGEPIIDSPSDSMTGPTYGTNRLGELKWVSDKFYLGVANYNGRPCYVYRNYESQKAQVELDNPYELNQKLAEPAATAKSELSDSQSARISATAFIDKATMRPVALETMYGVQLYDWSPSFQPFNLPAKLEKAAKDRAEAIAKRKQRYLKPQ